MPAIVIAVAGAAAGAAAAEGIGLVAGTLLYSVVSGGVAAITSSIVGGLLAHPSSNNPRSTQATPATALVDATSNYGAIPVIYGHRRIGGTRVFTETYGGSNEYLDLVIVWCEGEIDSISQLYLDDIPITDARFSGLTYYENYTGTDAQAASGELISTHPGKWSSTDTLSGIAYSFVRLTWNATAFPRGAPVVTADIYGRKVYDSRDAGTRYSNNPALCIRDYLTHARYGWAAPTSMIDDTALSASANFCDERVTAPTHSTTFTADASTDQVTLAGLDVFVDGMGVRFTSTTTLPSPLSAGVTYYWIGQDPLTVTSVATQNRGKLATTFANAMAGTAIDLTDAGTGTHTVALYDMQRYTCDGVVNIDSTLFENLRALLTSCRGFLVFSGGQYRLKNEKADSSVSLTLTESNIIGGWKIQLPQRRTRYNRVIASFFDAAQMWQSNVAVSDSSVLRATDNGVLLAAGVDLPFTGNTYTAQAIAQQVLNQSRYGIVVQVHCTQVALQLEVGDVVPITHTTPGWTAELFRVTAIQIMANDEVQLTLAQYNASVYSVTLGDFVSPKPTTNLPNPANVGAPGNPAITEDIYETRGGRGVAAKAIMTWSASSGSFVYQYQPEYRLVGATDYTLLPRTSGLTAEVLDVAPGRYDFRVKTINQAGAASSYASSLNQEIIGLSAVPATPTNVSLQISGGTAILTLDQHPELDVRRGGRILVRHTEATSSQSWESSLSIGNVDSYPGDSVLIALPLKAGSYLVKARDALDQESTGFATAVTKQASVLTFTTLATETEEPTFSGTHTNTVVASSTLKLDVSGADVLASGSYAFAAGFNFGLIKRVRITGKLQASVYNVNALLDDRITNIDDWVDFDGTTGIGSVCDAWLEARETDTDPTGSPTWSAWKRVDSADFQCWGMQFRAQLRSTDAAYNVGITTLQVKAENI